MQTNLQILLATYHSEKYLRHQIDSLLKQDCQDFQLLIRDGGSGDCTVEIIREYVKKYPGKMVFAGSRKASALENFSALLQKSNAGLVMFSDHDDIWFPQKISMTLKKYGEMAAAYGQETPILVFTDSCITDQNLNVISDSMLRYQNLKPDHLSLNRLILQNVPSGNTMLFNRALLRLALPVPPEAVMHDHWITLAAAAFGKIGWVDQPTLYYRQHGGNVYGASKYSLISMAKKLREGRTKIRARFEENIRQAAAFGQRYNAKLSVRDREMLSALEHWNEYGFWQKRKILLKYRILKSGFLRNLGMFILI